MLILALVLGFVWGGIWAAFLQFVPFGRFLAVKRTWLTVVIGIGVDVLIALLVIPWEQWWPFVAIIAVSSVLIIFRSLYNELTETKEIIEAVNGQARNGNKNKTRS